MTTLRELHGVDDYIRFSMPWARKLAGRLVTRIPSLRDFRSSLPLALAEAREAYRMRLDAFEATHATGAVDPLLKPARGRPRKTPDYGGMAGQGWPPPDPLDMYTRKIGNQGEGGTRSKSKRPAPPIPPLRAALSVLRRWYEHDASGPRRKFSVRYYELRKRNTPLSDCEKLLLILAQALNPKYTEAQCKSVGRARAKKRRR